MLLRNKHLKKYIVQPVFLHISQTLFKLVGQYQTWRLTYHILDFCLLDFSSLWMFQALFFLQNLATGILKSIYQIKKSYYCSISRILVSCLLGKQTQPPESTYTSFRSLIVRMDNGEQIRAAHLVIHDYCAARWIKVGVGTGYVTRTLEQMAPQRRLRDNRRGEALIQGAKDWFLKAQSCKSAQIFGLIGTIAQKKYLRKFNTCVDACVKFAKVRKSQEIFFLHFSCLHGRLPEIAQILRQICTFYGHRA